MTTVKSETKEFQAEVKQLLDIVIHSLYTEKEIFLRELISNSADALEKMRHEQLTAEDIFDKDAPLQISISFDEEAKTLTITDSGIGMTRDEMERNLGTIAHSGSKKFFTELAENARKDVNLIGQFGVGFYAAFMVANKVTVQSRSAQPDAEGCEWISEGAGNYTLSQCDGLHRGTKIILELSEDNHEFASEFEIKRIIKQYSNFVSFPINIGGEAVNTVDALWAKSKSDIKDEDYTEFYKFISNAMDEPLTHLHFAADAPLAIKSLLFIPKDNFETLGFGRMDPGVSLYCRKVLIEQDSPNILPEWLRFVKGIVDSEDLPLNISRQSLQDNALVAKLSKIITSRLLKHLGKLATKDPETYATIWKTFGIFLKEGATSDYMHRDAIAKLLRFESSKSEPGQQIPLAEYVERMGEEQKEIYYINGPSRKAIESGPYLEAFKKNDIEVIYTMEPIDDFVFSHMGEFDGKKLVSADRADIKLPESDEKEDSQPEDKLDSAVADTLIKWMKDSLGDKVKEVIASNRLVGSPAIIVNPDSMFTSSMERIMSATNQDHQASVKNLEINISHPLIKGLADMRTRDADFAKAVAEQIYDNALIQAGLMVEPRNMVDRSYEILARALK
ncbi:MAG: molecular chaperone HtpG [Desulfobulbaceae bacterium]|jgi:TNF receptor-associated protein 1|nr:molecular chaperone HtpG [Desulfobulbaceae bacterium]